MVPLPFVRSGDLGTVPVLWCNMLLDVLFLVAILAFGLLDVAVHVPNEHHPTCFCNDDGYPHSSVVLGEAGTFVKEKSCCSPVGERTGVSEMDTMYL